MKKSNLEKSNEKQERIISFKEQYAMDFVLQAIENGLNKTEVTKIIIDSWNYIKCKEKLDFLSSESPEEQEFRRKAYDFILVNEGNLTECSELLPRNGWVSKTEFNHIFFKFYCPRKRFNPWTTVTEEYDNQAALIDSDFFVEVLCGIYKVFTNFDHFSLDDIVNITRKRVDLIFYELYNRQGPYIKAVTIWYIIFASQNTDDEKCSTFVNSFSYDTDFEKQIARLIYLVKNCEDFS